MGVTSSGLGDSEEPRPVQNVMRIVEDDLSDPKVIALLGEHLQGMAHNTPPESVHALDLRGLKAASVTFWTVWDGAELCGCGALKELDSTHGEIKSMRTVAAHLGKGVGKAMLEHIIDEAKRRGYSRLSLETGSTPAFVPALKLYEKSGFVYSGPFGDYRDDPLSLFMTLEIS